ncbi:pseudouridine synthase [Shewanella salipaludis]|uniref:Pseudouridine synthase n=1 Tax=Shewanella salipaludis TaxID=2723052 RepID=A0A972FX20_9GAMM|nr:16S rRNA pseudouridine(516) synthase [Shewanella salipaludis]NMH64828.1 16S rRNA pseudouridine(516) synthase [Shewanella salipaludis]
MQSKRGRLDRFICTKLQISRKEVRLLLLAGRVEVDSVIVTQMDRLVDEFSRISVDSRLLQANTPSYLMLHKPVGVVSATRDEQHKTALDLLCGIDKTHMHIAGRLDLNSSGLLLITNDGRWSAALTSPEHKVDKVYLVTLENPLTCDYVAAFAEGMYFGFEDITTAPAKLEILGEHLARVTLSEGKYHQIKRMFGRFRNPVLALHRLSIGDISLDPGLAPGESRELTATEIGAIYR